MSKFSDEWLNNLHCILWLMREVNIWNAHKVLYEASKKGLIKINSWEWFGGKPRSSEVDAAIALLEFANVIVRENDVVKVVRPPLIDCKLISGFEETIKSICTA